MKLGPLVALVPLVPVGLSLLAAAPNATAPNATAHDGRGADACRAAVTSVERRWGGTGAWRRLAPYPVPREASPTDSVGVWLERWTRDDGRVELRRVSAGETLVAEVGEGCDVRTTARRRTFDAAATANAFTDEALRATLAEHRRGVIYVWSPGMPLSVRGLAEARAAAGALGVAFTAVVADARPGELALVRPDPADARPLDALELVYRDATIHYPAALFYADGKPLGTAVPGYKSRDTYAALARERFAGNGPPAPAAAGPAPALWVDRKAQVTTLATVPTVRHVGFFFKPVPGTDLVSYTAPAPGAIGGGGESYLFDLKTRAERRIPGNVDPVPTPDGRFVTRPGLVFHPVAALTAGDERPFYTDPELPDEYQSISILRQTKRALRYRVVTGWRVGLRLRDYDVALGRSGAADSVRPAGAPAVPCPDRRFTLPISARAGREVGVYDLAGGTNRVVTVGDDGACTDVLDLGFASGKLAFSYDGAALAFATSRVDTDAEGALLRPSELFYKDALVLYRKTGRIVSLSANRPMRAMTFPEFLPDGRGIVLDQAGGGRTDEVIRVVKVR